MVLPMSLTARAPAPLAATDIAGDPATATDPATTTASIS